jgi:hypothetical protein
MGNKLKMGILALAGVLGVAAFAPAAKADEGRFGHERFAHFDRFDGYRDRFDGYRDNWRRERFEHRRWDREHGMWRYDYRFYR